MRPINAVANQNAMRISTGTLNSILADATTRVQPPTDKGRRLKVYYITQSGDQAPHIRTVLQQMPSCSTSPISGIWRTSFGRYSALRATPIKLIIRQKGEDGDKV